MAPDAARGRGWPPPAPASSPRPRALRARTSAGSRAARRSRPGSCPDAAAAADVAVEQARASAAAPAASTAPSDGTMAATLTPRDVEAGARPRASARRTFRRHASVDVVLEVRRAAGGTMRCATRGPRHAPCRRRRRRPPSPTSCRCRCRPSPRATPTPASPRPTVGDARVRFVRYVPPYATARRRPEGATPCRPTPDSSGPSPATPTSSSGTPRCRPCPASSSASSSSSGCATLVGRVLDGAGAAVRGASSPRPASPRPTTSRSIDDINQHPAHGQAGAARQRGRAPAVRRLPLHRPSRVRAPRHVDGHDRHADDRRC